MLIVKIKFTIYKKILCLIMRFNNDVHCHNKLYYLQKYTLFFFTIKGFPIRSLAGRQFRHQLPSRPAPVQFPLPGSS